MLLWFDFVACHSVLSEELKQIEKNTINFS